MRLLVLLTALIAHSAIAAPSVTDIVISEGTNFAIDIAPPGVAGDRQLLIDLQGILWLLPAGGGTGQPLNAPEADLRLPRVSPDGSLITFQWFINGAWHIGVMKPDGSGLSQLTSGAPDDHGPVWSTDGSAILFSSDRAGNFDLWSFDLAGEALTQVTHNAADDFAPAVSPDGRHLAFLSDRSGKPALYLQTGDGPAEKIADAPAGRLYTPRFSPTGSHIAFVQADERLAFPAIARNRLVAIDLSAGEQITVSTDTEDVFGFAPAWLDNETLIYAADGQIRERRLGSTASADIPFRVKLSLQRSDLEPNTSERFPQRKQPVRGIVNPVTTPDGNRIIFTALGDLWVRHRDGRLEQLTNDVFVERDPDISHDNTQLAFISDRAGDMQIWIRNLLDDRDRQLTSNSRGPRYPTFDHSGTRLAYQQVGPRGTQDFTVHILDISSGDTRRLREAPKIWPGPMSWSADDAYLTVAALTSTSKRFREGVNQLVRIHVDDDKAQLNELPDAQVVDFGPVASPGGAQTALIIDGALWRVATAPDGSFAGPPERVLDELADYPSWTANARQIVFLSNRGLETLDVENQRRKHLAIDLDWQPAQSSGRRIVHAGKLFDGVDANYRDNIDITIDGATIVSVRPHEAHPENIEVIDAGGRTVLPGLIDHHMHFQPHEGEWVGRAWLSFGVTTVVEPGGLPYQSREIMEAWASGKRPGPRLVFAGPQLDGMRRHFDFAAHINSDKRLAWEMQRARRLGYGLIKTYTRMPPDRQRKTVTLAHELGIPVTAHAALRNLAFGGDRVEHLRGTSRIGYSPKQTEGLRSYADIIEIMAANRTALTPTCPDANHGRCGRLLRLLPATSGIKRGPPL
jgi:Tol biopolymer transport system component